MRVSSFIVVVFLLSTPALALNPMLRIGQYAHTAWTLRNDALKGYPRSIAQTVDGYLWLGTELGIVRFDGTRFVPWQPPSGASLPSDSVVRLIGTRDGGLWIGTQQGLACWKNGTLTHYDALAGDYVSALLEARDGTVWVGTSAGLRGTAKLCAIRSGRADCAGADAGLGRFVASLYEDASGTLWVGAATGLWRWKPGPPTIYRTTSLFPELHAIAGGDDGTVLVATTSEIRELSNGALTRYPLQAAGQLRPLALLRDRDGGLWIGTQDQGVLRTYRGRTDRFTRADGSSISFVTALFEDREGNVWVASLKGLDQFRELVVTTISAREGLSSDSVASVLSARDGSVWLGTGNGLDRWKAGRIARHRAPLGALNGGIGSLFEDARGRLWASSHGGIGFLHAGRATAVGAIGRGYVQAIAEDAPDSLWISDQERGLVHLRGSQVVELIPWTRFGGRNARTLAANPGGGLWLGFFQGGVALLSDGAVRMAYDAADGLGRGQVTSLHIDRHGALWAATEGGLSRLQDGRITTLTRKNGLPCETVHWVIEDDSRALWLYTACGLVRVVQSEVEAWTGDPARTVALSIYDETDGVWVRSTLGSYGPKVAKSADGRLWFATYSGAGVIDPARLPFNASVPPVHIEQVTADRQTLDAATRVRLPAGLRDLRIMYTATSLVAPEKVRFRYRLEGRDRDWVDAGGRREAFYTDLPPKSYRFRVIAANNDGVWNDEGAVWDFSIQPTLYQTTVFKVGAAGLALVVLWASYLVRVRRLAAEMHVRFEERLTERTRMAQELHDTFLQGFLSTSMQLHILADELSDTPARSKLERILGRLRTVMEEGRLTVFSLRAPTGIDDLEHALARDGADLRGDQPVDLRVMVEGKRQPIRPLIRDEIYRICREALANAFRHARATRVEVAFEYDAAHLRVHVRDDGCGIRQEVIDEGLEGHLGIHGMRQRAERIGATLKLWSRAAGGTEVELVVPAHVVFQPEIAVRDAGGPSVSPI